MKLRLTLSVVILICCAGVAHAQQNLVYNHYFLNPFLYNPSYLAHNGYTELYLNYRKQWAGFGDNAPSTATLNFHLPISYKMGIGATAYQDQQGVLRTTTALLSYGYQIYFGKNVDQVHKLAFGISAGMTYSYIPPDRVDNGDIPDNALSNRTSSMDGQVGFHYQLKNFRLSFALPRLFRTYVTSSEDFNSPSIQQITSTISSVSYNFALSQRIAFEPFIIYRTEKDFDPQYEAAGVLRIDNIAWLGGSYRQDYGPSAFLGFNIKDRYKVGYAYEFAPEQISGIGGGSHEFQLVVRLGKKKTAFARKEQTPPMLAKDTARVETLADKPLEEQEETRQEEKSAEEKSAPQVAPEQQPDPGNVVPPPADQVTIVPNREEVAKSTPEEESKKHGGESLMPGHYVVVGAFVSPINAKNYVNTLRKVGYPASMSYYSSKNLYIVHMGNTATIEEARELRNQYRARSRYSFRDTWVLSIE